ncbi:antibiotic biosynthesis monooxygenase [Staphylococcus devriesei]|uniref:Signal transduction protein TRAP n=1 Tax=Staphylococcus devriesei TaxID=586733 RepID=A0A2K4DQ97_9STAP|nr:putative quinol monooxygenase [Staphylococcus devriesei]MCE5090251.1 antibiotic biosynthesis monooxygenase [Staphylococcus devriesei]MCE5096966.1 antibiotic biosynthesis monooxygenase [Staphylococcus devriesei]PNZ88972.1 antibiotic biosynthesis monooxygenase [Staphylococcus devriesei]PTE73733.1 antibiotic biosynthesis monooxygenase [Staphylococcus devriesei]PTF04824.1 antibiotic biosynthesis monooxygenase [Staphylococcus devriesei]
MIIINAKLKVNEAYREEYLELMKGLVDNARQEEGNTFYSHYEDVSERNTFVVVENYKDQEAVEAHNHSEHFKVFSENIGKYITEQPEIDVAETK